MKRSFTLLLSLALLTGATALPLHAQSELLLNGSFELPPVGGRTPKARADLLQRGQSTDWAHFEHKRDDKNGRLVAGLTTEAHRTGRQCVYVEFDKLVAPHQSGAVATKPILIAPGKEYRVSIWGRLDAKNPLTNKGRMAYLKLEINYYQKDGETQTGNSVFLVHPLPGARESKPLFVVEEWREFAKVIISPEDAASMVVSWRWESSPEKGETNGVIFFDDASIKGQAVPRPEEPAEPMPDEAKPDEKPAKPAEEKPAAPAKTP